MTFCWRGSWQGMVLVEDTLITNEWEFSIYFDSSGSDPLREQIALDRCRFLIENIFQDSLWLSVEDNWNSVFHNKLKGHRITLPVLPFDSAIAIATLSKCIAISEDHLDFQQIILSSRLGEGIELTVDVEDLEDIEWLVKNPVHEYTKDHAWFMRSNPGTCDVILSTSEDSIEVIRDMLDWNKYDLGWEPNQEIIFTPDIESDVPAPRPAKSVWKPVVIDGGKNEG